MSTTSRGASYPSVALSEAVQRVRVAMEKVGKGPNTKEEYIKGLGYKGVSGASSRTFAALIHYGLVTKTGVKYRISELATEILFPTQGTLPDSRSLARAALSPKLFEQLYQRFLGERIPDMLSNTLIVNYEIHNKSAEEASANFRASLEYAGLYDGDVVKSIDEIDFNAEHNSDASEIEVNGTYNASNTTSDEGRINRFDHTNSLLIDESGPEKADINRFEIVLREGSKAGIYAPYGLSDDEKDKLKKLIDLL